MAWDGSDECQECFAEALKTEPNPIKRARMVETLPCSKHGHPGWMSSRLRAWIDFFEVVAPYSTPQTLDHSLIWKICKETGIPFMDALEKLTVILKAYNANTDKGIQQGDS